VLAVGVGAVEDSGVGASVAGADWAAVGVCAGVAAGDCVADGEAHALVMISKAHRAVPTVQLERGFFTIVNSQYGMSLARNVVGR
jgi:hypothetical protein